MAVTIASLLKNNAKHRFRIVAVLDQPDAEAEGCIRRTVKSFGNAEIEFKNFDLSSFTHFRVDRHITVASYLRLFMTQFLESDLERVLYLDCDLIINDDIEALWATDISRYFLAAVPDPYSDNHVILGFREDEKYFNAGVLLVNLAKWRETDVVPKFIQFVEENSSILRYHDQCTLNAIFRDQVLLLPYRWNFAARSAELSPEALDMTKKDFAELRQLPSIVHYTTPVKPWLYGNEPHYKSLYYRYLALTPWGSMGRSEHTINTSTSTKTVVIGRLKRAFKWRAPALYRILCRFTGLGDAVLRKFPN